MRKLSQQEVKNLFESYGCDLVGEYLGSGIPVKYKCKCGVESAISLDKFRRRIKRGEGCESCNVFVWNDLFDCILRDFYGKEPRKRLMEMLPGVSYGSLKARARKLGLVGNKSVSMSKARGLVDRKYTVYDDFFMRKTLSNCYWAGVLSSGRVDVSKNSLFLVLPSSRRGLLERLQDVTCHTGVINVCGVSKVSLNFYGIGKWISDIKKNFGDIWKSSPAIRSEKGIIAFIVGYLDAKGEIRNFLREYRMELIGKKVVLSWIRSIFDKWVPPLVHEYASFSIGKRGNYTFCVWNVRAKFLVKKLWSVDVPRFDLIWEKFQSLK